MIVALAVGSGIALAAGNLYSRVRYRRSLPFLDDLYQGKRPAMLSLRGETDVEEGQEEVAETSVAIAEMSEEQITRDVLIIALTSTTAVIHILLPNPLFVYNGIGFAGLLAAHYLAPPRETYRQHTRTALFGYTGFTFVAYFVAKTTAAAFSSVPGIACKLVELGLINVLWKDRQAALNE